MSKYSHEFKLEVVKYCLETRSSFDRAAKHFGMPSKSPVQKWVRKYQKHGPSGLMRNYHKYDGKFKQYVVEYMHANHLSFFETAIQFNLSGVDIVAKWEHIYYEEGVEALYEKRRGPKKYMNSKSKKTKKENEDDLIAENQRLRMENEYLKKLNALVQERIKRENKKK